MVSARHSKQTVAQGIHGIVAYEYPNAAARLSATDFTSADLYKIAIQTDDNTVWMITGIFPIAWSSVQSNVPGQNPGDMMYYDGSNWVVLPLGADGYVLAANTALTKPNWIVPSGGTATASPNFGIGAGTQTISSGTLIISNSNGISFGINGSTLTASYSVPSTVGLISRINISAGTTSNNLSALTFNNVNGLSFGLDGSTITGSYTVPSTAGLISAINISGGTTSNNLSALTFSNFNNISFGLNGSIVTASASFPVQTNQTVGLYGVGNTTQNSSTTLDARSLSFNGLGDITVGYSNGSIQISGSQTVQSQNIAVPSAGTQTATSGTVVFSNSNGISFGMSGSSRITASYTVPSTAGLISNINISAGTTSNNLSALTFSNANGLSFGLDGSTITGSYTVPSTAGLISRINISAGTTSNNLSAITFSNANGITFGLDGSTITASYQPGAGASINFSAGTTSNNLTAVTFSNSNGLAFGLDGSVITGSYTIPTQSNQTAGLYALGNTTQNSSTTLDIRSLSFNGLGDITVGYSNGSIQISGSQTVQTQSNVQGISAGTQVGRTGDIVFSNSNGISFGMSGSSRITASYTVPSTAGLISNINVSAGTTSNNLSALTFDNANGLSFGLDGSTITGSYTVPSTVGLISRINVSAGTTSNNLSAFTFSNANGITFGLDGSTITASYQPGAGASLNFSAGTTSNNLTAVTFSNSNGLSFGLNGSTITGSYTVPVQTNQTLGLFATGNTTQNSSTTLDARSLTFNAIGGATFGYSNGSIQLSVPSTIGLISGINVSAGTTSNNLSAVTFSNSNGLSFGLDGSTITGSYTVPSTAGLISRINISAGTTSNNLSALTLSNSNGISFGLDGSTITASYTVPSTAGLISNINISAGTTSNNLSALTFSNSNGISFGLDGSTVTASYTVPTQSNQTAGLYGLGNTTQNSSTTLDIRSLSFNGLGDITVGYSNGSIQVSGSQTVQTQSNVQGISAGTQVGRTGDIVFSNSNGISFGMSGSSRITASYTVPSTAGLISNINVSAGTTSNNLSALTFSNANGLSFGLDGSTITGSYTVPTVPAQTNQTLGLYAVSNTTEQSTSSTIDARSISFNGAGAVSVGYSNGSIVVSAPTQTVQTSNIVVPSAGTQTATSGTVVFSNSNGISFGMSGSSRITASYTVPSTVGLISAINVSGGTTSNNLSAITFSNSNNVSFGLDGSTVTASASFNQTVQTSNIVLPSAGTQTASSGTVIFSNSNGISFGMSGSSRITASYTVPSTAGLISAINVSAGTTSNNLSAITFSNANGISFGLDGSTITASVQAGAAAGIGGIQAGTQTATSGTIIFSNSNGISFGLSGSSRITASYTVPTQTNQTLGFFATGNTTQNSSTTLDARSLTFNGLGAISVGYSNGSIQISSPNGSSLSATGAVSIETNGDTISIGAPIQTNQTLGFFATGNTTQNSSTTFDARSLTFNAIGGISAGYSNGSIQLSVVTQTVQTSNIVVPSAGTQTATSGTVVFSNSNGISFGMSGSSRITASYTVPSTAGLLSAINISAGTTSNNLSAVTFSNSNGLAFGMNGSTITGSYTVPSVAGLLSAINVSAGTTSNNLSAITFSNANNVSFGINGSTVTASASFAAQTNQTLGLYAVSNTTGGSSSSTIDARSLSFQGAGIASIGYSNGSVVVSVPAGGGGLTNINISAGTTSNNLSALTFSNGNGVTFGLDGSTITASVSPGGGGGSLGLYAVGNTTQNSSTTLTQNSISFNGLGGMTVGYSNSSIQLSAPPVSSLVGVGGIVLSTNVSTISIGLASVKYLEPFPIFTNNTVSISQGQASLYFQPFLAPLAINSGRINFINAFTNSMAVSTANFNSNTTGSRGVSLQFLKTLALYSQGTGTNSTRIESFWSNTWTMGLTQSVSVSSAAGVTMRATNAMTLNYIASIGTNGSYTTASTTASQTASLGNSSLGSTALTSGFSTLVNMISGTAIIPVGFDTSITAGNYWLMQGQSIGSTTAGTSAQSLVFSFIAGIGGMSTHPRLFGQTAQTSISQMIPGQGVFSAASASPPSTMAFSDIRSVASNVLYYFNILASNA